MKFDLSLFRRAQQDAFSQLQQLDKRKSHLNVELAMLERAPPTRDEVKSFVVAWVEARAQECSLAFSGDALRTLIANPLPAAPNTAWLRLAVPGDRSEPVSVDVLEGLLCRLCGAQLIEGFFQTIDANPWPEGLPKAERSRRAAELRDELAIIEPELRELRQEIAKARRHV